MNKINNDNKPWKPGMCVFFANKLISFPYNEYKPHNEELKRMGRSAAMADALILKAMNKSKMM